MTLPTDLASQLDALAAAARAAYRTLATVPAEQKADGLRRAAAALRADEAAILAANAADLAAAAALDAPMRDRLRLDPARIAAMATGIEQVAGLPDPVGRTLERWPVAHNGLTIERRSVPLGVIGMIYESRPNVTADAAALAVKAGNAVILRGGSESALSSAAIGTTMRRGLAEAGLPIDAVQLLPTQDRAAVGWMLGATGAIDVIIPRGGQALTERVAREARVPTLLHLTGNCHVYLHAAADSAVAHKVVLNAKLRRTSVCGALESLLIDRHADPALARTVVAQLLAAGCAVRGDQDACALDPRVKPANEADWGTEYLAPILSLKFVDGLDAAIAHINRYGSQHSDAIVTTDETAAARFTAEVDSAIVLVNASTQFADGGEFGFGAEIGIATGRLHARGPVGAAQLTTYKYVVSTDDPAGAARAG